MYYYLNGFSHMLCLKIDADHVIINGKIAVTIITSLTVLQMHSFVCNNSLSHDSTEFFKGSKCCLEFAQDVNRCWFGFLAF